MSSLTFRYLFLPKKNLKTGEITNTPIDISNVENLETEFFESSEFYNSGEEFAVCPNCHKFILKVIIEEGIGKHLFEKKVCMNPDCET
jgi:hypothetical protein